AGVEQRLRVGLRFTARPSSLVGGFVIGGGIALLTVWATSVRIGRLNVIRALRDLPEPPPDARRSPSLVAGAPALAAGGALFVTGTASKSWFGALVGVPLAAVASIPLLRRAVGRRAAGSWACIVTLIWGVTCFTLLPKVFENTSIPTFVVQGIMLVAAAVGL